jgi:predicted oxidoreductase (fatty acid repression mutant protein)
VTLNKKEARTEKDQVQKEKQKIKSKVNRELKHFESSYNPDATRIVNDTEQERDIILNQANIALFSGATKF